MILLWLGEYHTFVGCCCHVFVCHCCHVFVDLSFVLSLLSLSRASFDRC